MYFYGLNHLYYLNKIKKRQNEKKVKHSNEQNLSSSSTNLSHSQRVSPSRPQTPRFFSLALNRYPSISFTPNPSLNRVSLNLVPNRSHLTQSCKNPWLKQKKSSPSAVTTATMKLKPHSFASSKQVCFLFRDQGFLVVFLFCLPIFSPPSLIPLSLFMFPKLGFQFGIQGFNRETSWKCFLCSESGCPV